MNKGKIIFLPFEKFVLRPNNWINEIINFLEIKKTSNLNKELKKQKVPRKFLHDGYKRNIYKRFGNKPKKSKFTSFEEADKNYKFSVKSEFLSSNKQDMDTFNRLENLSNNYRKWIDIFDKKISFD